MPDITKITDHATLALARLLQKFQDKDLVRDVIDVIGDRAQTVEDMASDIYTLTPLAVAADDQLDQYGELLGLERQSFSDDRYRALLKTQIAIIHSNGHGDELIAILKLLADTTTVELYELFPDQVWFEYLGSIFGTDQPWAESLDDKLSQAASAGVLVRPVVEYQAGSFRFDTADVGFDEGTFGTDVSSG